MSGGASPLVAERPDRASGPDDALKGWEISRAIAADLGDFSAALDVSEATRDALTEAVQTLLRDLGLAVRSFLGMSIAFDVYGEPMTLRLLDDDLPAAEIGSSLRFPVELLAPLASASGTAVLYAERPGAFTDLAADLTFVLRLTDDEVILNADLLPPARSNLDGMDQLTVIDQAVGVLIARGYSAEGARTELRSSTGPHGSLRAAAEDVLAVR